MAHHQGAVGNGHGDGELLLDEQHRDSPGLEGLQILAHQLHDLGRQALGRFVDDDEVRVAHEGAAQREHLLLATRHHARFCVLAFLRRGTSGTCRQTTSGYFAVALFAPSIRFWCTVRLGNTSRFSGT